jgi:hypothetical protein
MTTVMRRADFLALVETGLSESALVRVPFDPSPNRACTLFCRTVEDLVLCASIEFSALRASRVTASWFLGATLFWAYVPHDVPRKSYVRAPQLLNVDERDALCGPESTYAEGVSGYWWSPADGLAATNVLQVLKLTMPRFLDQAPVAEIRRSKEWKARKVRCESVAHRVGTRPTFASLAGARDLDPWLTAATTALDSTPANDKERKRLARDLAIEAALSAALGLV